MKLNEALDDLPVGVVILAAPKGEVVYVNKRAIELYGVDPRGLEIPNHSTRALRILTPDGSIFPPEQLPASRALLHGESVRNVELILEQPSLKRIIVSATTVPLR
ncbi:PAS domain-containing protein, partial [Candidatus Bathyarchaeota archaeon]|nr:PAS domain-containing protein [Candidatus Bathyarchaeota archaeon]